MKRFKISIAFIITCFVFTFAACRNDGKAENKSCDSVTETPINGETETDEDKTTDTSDELSPSQGDSESGLTDGGLFVW